jgi:two-component system, OmpR family, response regulator
MEANVRGSPYSCLKRNLMHFQVAVRFARHQPSIDPGDGVRILVIEDEPLLADAVSVHLTRAGHAVDCVGRLDNAEAALDTTEYGLVLLDLNLPDGRGLDLLKSRRKSGDRRPVIICTARDQIRDRIEGLNAGADDYLVKPYDFDELLARVQAVQRRYDGQPNPALTVGKLKIDTTAHQVWHDGENVPLTAREWALIECLARRPGAIVSKAQVEDALYAMGSEVESNAVEVYVSRLRKKLGSTAIETVRGLGYRLGG